MEPSPTSGSRPGAVSFVCLVVAALSIFTVLDSIQATKTWAQEYPDTYGAARGDIRFAPLLARVATDAKLGYITDLETTNEAYSATFLAAQYAIAPRQLLTINPQARPEWALGNFTKPIDFASAGAAQGYDISMDFGNGVILFRRKPAP
jgi:hypothetical protein